MCQQYTRYQCDYFQKSQPIDFATDSTPDISSENVRHHKKFFFESVQFYSFSFSNGDPLRTVFPLAGQYFATSRRYKIGYGTLIGGERFRDVGSSPSNIGGTASHPIFWDP